MIWLKRKGRNILTSGFSLPSTVQPVTVLEALYVLSGKLTKLHDKNFVYFCLREVQFRSSNANCDLSSIHLFLPQEILIGLRESST